jgi:hypothetical protein
VTSILEQATPFPAELTSVDAYRRLVIFLMMAEILKFGRIAKAFPRRRISAFLPYTKFARRVGRALALRPDPDGVLFLGRVSLPLLIADRRRHGQFVVRSSETVVVGRSESNITCRSSLLPIKLPGTG